MVNDYYNNLYMINDNWTDWKQTSITFLRLDIIVQLRLNEEVSDNEVKCDMFAMKPWKVHRTDSFPGGFIKNPGTLYGGRCVKFLRMFA